MLCKSQQTLQAGGVGGQTGVPTEAVGDMVAFCRKIQWEPLAAAKVCGEVDSGCVGGDCSFLGARICWSAFLP